MPAKMSVGILGGLAGNAFFDDTIPCHAKTAVRQIDKIPLTARSPSFRIRKKTASEPFEKGEHYV